MGKLFAAIILIVSFVKLAPMCARLPADLNTLATPVAPAPVVVSTAAAPAPAPAPKPAYALDKQAVTVTTYKMKKNFKINEGRAMISVSVRNGSELDAKDLRLTLTVRRGGKNAEKTGTGSFELSASSSVYRGLYVTTASLDALIAEPAEEGAELRWDLTYRLDGDAADAKRCFSWRALPRAREPEGADWKELGSSHVCNVVP